MKFALPATKRSERFKRFLIEGGYLLLILIVILIAFGIASPFFFSATTLTNILLQSSMIGCIALGETLVIITAGIDLSLGAMVGVAAVVSALAQPYGTFVACSLALITCAMLGLVSGLLTAKGKVPPFIVTLAMMGIAQSIALVLSNGQIISGTTSSFRQIASSTFLGIQTPVWIFAALCFAVWFYLKKTRFGYAQYATGGNPQTACLSGIDTGSVLISVYAIAAALAAIAGIIYTSRMTVGQPNAGTGYEMYGIAAVVIGGTSMSGGKGGVTGTILGVLILGALSTFLNLIGITPFVHEALRGVIILLAVYFNMRQER